MKNDARMTFDEASHVYRLGDMVLTSVTQILAEAGLAQFDGPWFSDAVKARGTHLHTAIALDVEGDLDEDTLDEQLLGGVTGWRKFMADTGARIEFAEFPLCDPESRTAGRLDYIVVIPDQKHPGRTLRTVLDVKRALYPSAAIQLAAYAEMALPLYAQHPLFSRAALVLPGDGSYRLHRFTDPTDRATWHAAVRVVNWRKEHLKELAHVA
ncbi:MAG: hypothetical protein NUW22_04990 [Acidobacteria bacterium]|nr:hypothetical protein [Acidobacteriota bacterium]